MAFHACCLPICKHGILRFASLFLFSLSSPLSDHFAHYWLRRPGQEEGNVPFVEESGFGKYSSNPQIIADTVSSWLESPEKMDSMKEAALAAARPSATLDIAQDLAEIVFSTKKQTDAEKVLVAVR